MTFLAITDQAANLSLCGQLFSMLLALVIGRWCLRRREVILLICVLGTVGAMIADMLVDGQGAFYFLIFAPVIYLFATAGRRGLR